MTQQLSEQVILSIKDAQSDLRTALGFASKTEDAVINIALSQILQSTEQVLRYYDQQNPTFEDMIRQRFGRM